MNPTEIIKEYHGTGIENQRLRIVVERWSAFCGDFVHVFHGHGDDSITDMVFTYEEARHLLAVLQRIYPDDHNCHCHHNCKHR